MTSIGRFPVRTLFLLACPALPVVLWPELFLFSKVALYPAWATAWTDPTVAAWLIMLLMLSPTILTKRHFRRVAADLALATVLGPSLGAVIHCLSSGSNLANAFFQSAWAVVLMALFPSLVLLAMAGAVALVRRMAARSKPNPLRVSIYLGR